MYMCNIKPISNLTTILQVLISNRRAQGIEFIHRGISFSVQTDKEVILTAGTYGSPAILIRSGIGPADQLQRLQVRTSLILNFDLFVFIFVHKLQKMQVRTFLFYLVSFSSYKLQRSQHDWAFFLCWFFFLICQICMWQLNNYCCYCGRIGMKTLIYSITEIWRYWSKIH